MVQKDIQIVDIRGVQGPESQASAAPAGAGDLTPRSVDKNLLFTVRREIVRRNGRIGILLHVILAAALSLVLYGSNVPHIYVTGWLAFTLAVLLARSLFISRISADSTRTSRPLVGFAIFTGVMIGFVWGIAVSFLFFGLNTIETLIVVVAALGAMFGASSNGARTWVFSMWVGPIFVPLVAFAVMNWSLQYAVFTIVMVVIYIAMTRASANATRLFNRSASLLGAVERANERLVDNAHRFRIIADYSHDWECWFDKDGKLKWTSPSVERFTGYSADEVMLDPELITKVTIHPDDRARLASAVSSGAGSNARGDIDFRVLHRDGSERWCNSVSNPIINEKGEVDGFRASVRDISVQKRLEADLEQLASVDGLTGLLNRRAFMEKAKEEVYRSDRYHKPFVIALLDIDHFKRINDTYGHAAGDRCLVALAGIVSQSIRQSDLFARFGGEEFVLMLTETELSQGMLLCDRLRRRISSAKVEFGGETITMTASLGVADFLCTGETLDDMLARADAGLYEAKRNGRDQVVHGSSVLHGRGGNGQAEAPPLARAS